MTTPATEPNPPPAPPRPKRLPPRVRGLAWLAIAGIVAIGGAVGYRYFWYARPVGAGPAGRAVSADRFDDEVSTWSDRKVLMIGIGDSVTAGLGASTQAKSYFNR